MTSRRGFGFDMAVLSELGLAAYHRGHDYRYSS
jgi:hypothetical protein